jgi:hypothetical protein
MSCCVRRWARARQSHCACTRNAKDGRCLHVDVRFESQDKKGAIMRVLSFEGELDDDQRARLADIDERTPVTLTLKQGVVITTSVV